MQETITVKNIRWTHVSMPTPGELAALVRETNLLPIDAEFIAGNSQRVQMTARTQSLFFLIQVPVFNKQRRVTTSASLYLIVRQNELWTLQYEPLVVLDKLRRDIDSIPDAYTDLLQEGALGLALYIIHFMYDSATRKLDRLSKHIKIAEDAVFQGNERKMVEEIAILVRDVMNFRQIMRPHHSLFATPPTHPWLTPLLLVQWQHLDNQVNKVWETLEGLAETVHHLHSTNNSLLQHKVNELLRLLTYYSTLSIPLYIFLTPLSPRVDTGSPIIALLYWTTLLSLFIFLAIIFLRSRNKRVL